MNVLKCSFEEREDFTENPVVSTSLFQITILHSVIVKGPILVTTYEAAVCRFQRYVRC